MFSANPNDKVTKRQSDKANALPTFLLVRLSARPLVCLSACLLVCSYHRDLKDHWDPSEVADIR